MKVLIVGATSGLGLALAQHYLQKGDEVAVCGRDLKRIPQELQKRYTQLRMYRLDIADKQTLVEILEDFANPVLDLVIVTAGLYFNTRKHQLDEAMTLRMLQTNVSGLNHVFELAAKKMLTQKSGHLVAISSVAGLLRDYPGASLYSATKRSVLNLCETYRIALKPFSIAVTAVVPGYIDTEKLRTLNNGDASQKPFILSETQAVHRITKAVAQRKAVLIFPWQMRGLIAVLNCLPSWLLALRK